MRRVNVKKLAAERIIFIERFVVTPTFSDLQNISHSNEQFLKYKLLTKIHNLKHNHQTKTKQNLRNLQINVQQFCNILLIIETECGFG